VVLLQQASHLSGNFCKGEQARSEMPGLEARDDFFRSSRHVVPAMHRDSEYPERR
jgi:hypothetical protein